MSPPNPLIYLWRNDASRRAWLKDYRTWREVGGIEEIEMHVFAYTLPNGWELYAVETPCPWRDGDYYTVTYHIVKSEDSVYRQFPNSESEVAGELMALKKKLQEDNQA